MTKISSSYLDVLIVGGGISGLWLLDQLCTSGYNAALLESQQLGGGQTLAAQGIIHGGMKYMTDGFWRGSVSTIAQMPSRWQACLEGRGETDLSQVKVLSKHCLLCSSPGPVPRLLVNYASRLMNTSAITDPQHTEILTEVLGFSGAVRILADWVIDVPSLVETLYDRQKQRVFSTRSTRLIRTDNRIEMVVQDRDQSFCSIHPRLCILAAGAGNAPLMNQLAVTNHPMQLRPLRQIIVRGPRLKPLYAHFMGIGTKPEMTVTSHRYNSDEYLWYIGGNLAESSFELSPSELTVKVRSAIHKALPGINPAELDISTVGIDRAEPLQKRGLRPADASAQVVPELSNLIVAWPTKMTLVPALADKIFALLPHFGLSANSDLPPLPPEIMALEAAAPGAPPWHSTGSVESSVNG